MIQALGLLCLLATLAALRERTSRAVVFSALLLGVLVALGFTLQGLRTLPSALHRRRIDHHAGLADQHDPAASTLNSALIHTSLYFPVAGAHLPACWVHEYSTARHRPGQPA